MNYIFNSSNKFISFLSDVLKHKTQKLIIKVLNKKCFNGCRPAKKKRKKQKNKL